jgi:glycerate dehydrogenase
MNLVLLDADTLGSDLDLSSLEAFGDLEVYDITTPEETADNIVGAEAIITNKVVIDRPLMEATPTLKLICVAATGMNNIDLEAAQELGITVKNVAGYSTTSVAQHTFAMLLHIAEKMEYYSLYARGGAWSQSLIFTHLEQPFHQIKGQQWGIIGMGAIGQNVARIATAFDAKIVYHSTSGDNTDQPYPHLALDELLRTSDIVSIHAPLNDRTHNLLNADNLPLLRDGAVLLNLGRGGIIDEKALAAELDRRELYAGLDVTETEPIPSYNPLMHIQHTERLLMTPHIAWASVEARQKLLEGIVNNIRDFLSAPIESPLQNSHT